MGIKKHKQVTRKKRFKISPEERAHHEVKKREIVEKINAVLSEGQGEVRAEQPSAEGKPQETPIVTPPVTTEPIKEPASADTTAQTPEQAAQPQVTSSVQSSEEGKVETEPVQDQPSAPSQPVDNLTEQPAGALPQENVPQVTDQQSAATSEVPDAGPSVTTQEKTTEKPAPSSTQPPWRSDATGEQISTGGGSTGGPSRKKLLWILLVPILIGVILIDGYIIYTKLLNKDNTKSNKAPLGSVATGNKGTPTATPTPNEMPVDLTKYSISVLNGSGIRGLAAKVQNSLVADGFVVESVGNANRADYTETVISVKKDVPKGYITKLRESLSESYKVAKNTQTLDPTESVDVSVIIGSQEAE